MGSCRNNNTDNNMDNGIDNHTDNSTDNTKNDNTNYSAYTNKYKPDNYIITDYIKTNVNF